MLKVVIRISAGTIAIWIRRGQKCQIWSCQSDTDEDRAFCNVTPCKVVNRCFKERQCLQPDWRGKPKVLMLCTGRRCNWHICLGRSSTGTGHIMCRIITQSTVQGRQVGLVSSWHKQNGWPDLTHTHTHTHTHTRFTYLQRVRETCQSLPEPAQDSLFHSLSPSPHHTHSYTDSSTVHPRPYQVAQLWCQPDLGQFLYLF